MAEAQFFHVSVVTPEKPVLESDARFVAFPPHDGQAGVLVHRAAFLHRVGSGPLRVEASDGSTELLFVSGGFAQMVDDRLTILTEQAVAADELDQAAAEAALADATALPAADEASHERRQRAIDSAHAQARMTD